jgi:hypothetical protein
MGIIALLVRMKRLLRVLFDAPKVALKYFSGVEAYQQIELVEVGAEVPPPHVMRSRPPLSWDKRWLRYPVAVRTCNNNNIGTSNLSALLAQA